MNENPSKNDINKALIDLCDDPQTSLHLMVSGARTIHFIYFWNCMTADFLKLSGNVIEAEKRRQKAIKANEWHKVIYGKEITKEDFLK